MLFETGVLTDQSSTVFVCFNKEQFDQGLFVCFNKEQFDQGLFVYSVRFRLDFYCVPGTQGINKT